MKSCLLPRAPYPSCQYFAIQAAPGCITGAHMKQQVTVADNAQWTGRALVVS